MNHPSARDSRLARQRGASLVVVLLILIIVTLLGAGAAQMSLLGERTTRADRDRQIAFQAAEAALEDAFIDISSPSTNTSAARAAIFNANSRQGFVKDCNTGAVAQGLCLRSATGKDVWLNVDFKNADDTKAASVALGHFTGRSGISGTGSGLVPALKPRYIIEAIDDRSMGTVQQGNPTVYRVTAIGFGPTSDAQVVLQGEFRR